MVRGAEFGRRRRREPALAAQTSEEVNLAPASGRQRIRYKTLFGAATFRLYLQLPPTSLPQRINRKDPSKRAISPPLIRQEPSARLLEPHPPRRRSSIMVRRARVLRLPDDDVREAGETVSFETLEEVAHEGDGFVCVGASVER